MKYIKNGIIYEPNSEFVEEQMKKYGYILYEESKEEEIKDENVEEKTTKKKKK